MIYSKSLLSSAEKRILMQSMKEIFLSESRLSKSRKPRESLFRDNPPLQIVG